MSDEAKKIIVDDDWKEQARKEKERLAAETQPGPRGAAAMGAAQFAELVNVLAMQALVGLGMMSGPGGERIPPNLDLAKHFIDLLQVLDDKTKGNLSADEKRVIDQVLYEIRMRYVQLAGAMGGASPPR